MSDDQKRFKSMKDTDIGSVFGDAIAHNHAIERSAGAVLGSTLGYRVGSKLSPAAGVAGGVLGFATGATGAGKLMRFLERGNKNLDTEDLSKTALDQESARRFEILKQAAGFDPMKASRTGGFLAKGVEGTLGTAKTEQGKRLGQKALDVMGAAAGQAVKAAPNMMGALKNKAVDIYKAVKGSSGSLADLAMELYGNGDIREDVMLQALNQAAGVKIASQMNQILKLAFLRSSHFGAESPTAALLASKMADDKSFGTTMLAGAGQAVGGGLMSAALRAGEAGVRWLTDKTPQHVEESYKTMLKANPDFEHKQDVVRGHFDVLKTYAPSLAKNPLAAAGHIRQAMEMGQMIPVDTINKLVQTEKLHQEAGVRPSIFGK